MTERMVTLTLKGYTPAGFELSMQLLDVAWDKAKIAVEGLDEKAGQMGLTPGLTRNNHTETKQALDLAAPTCKIHGVAMELHEKGSSKWYSHKVIDADGTEKWCRGK